MAAVVSVPGVLFVGMAGLLLIMFAMRGMLAVLVAGVFMVVMPVGMTTMCFFFVLVGTGLAHGSNKGYCWLSSCCASNCCGVHQVWM